MIGTLWRRLVARWPLVWRSTCVREQLALCVSIAESVSHLDQHLSRQAREIDRLHADLAQARASADATIERLIRLEIERDDSRGEWTFEGTVGRELLVEMNPKVPIEQQLRFIARRVGQIVEQQVLRDRPDLRALDEKDPRVL